MLVKDIVKTNLVRTILCDLNKILTDQVALGICYLPDVTKSGNTQLC